MIQLLSLGFEQYWKSIDAEIASLSFINDPSDYYVI